MPELLVAALARSRSNPDQEYIVHIDTSGPSLTCQCPAWTRRTHHRTCPGVTSGNRCTCVDMQPVMRDHRTCPHVRSLATEIESAGGIRAVIARIRAGRPWREQSGGVTPELARLQPTIERVLNAGPTRVIVNEHMEGVAPSSPQADGYRRPDVIFVRRDGWSVGASGRFIEPCSRLYHDEWAAVINMTVSPPRVEAWRGILPITDGSDPMSVVQRPRSSTRTCAHCGRTTAQSSGLCTRQTCRRSRVVAARTARLQPAPQSDRFPGGRLYVIAESFTIARNVCETDLRLRRDEWTYVDTDRAVGGVRREAWYLAVDGFWRVGSNVRLLEMLRARGCTGVTVRDLQLRLGIDPHERATSTPATAAAPEVSRGGQRVIVLPPDDEED